MSAAQTRSQPFVTFQGQTSLTSHTDSVMIYPTDHCFLPHLPFSTENALPHFLHLHNLCTPEAYPSSGHDFNATTFRNFSLIVLLPSPTRRSFLASELTSSDLLLLVLFSISKLIRGTFCLPLPEWEFLKTKFSVPLFSHPRPQDLAQRLAPASFRC